MFSVNKKSLSTGNQQPEGVGRHFKFTVRSKAWTVTLLCLFSCLVLVSLWKRRHMPTTLSFYTVLLLYLCSPWRCSSLHQLLHISPWGPTPPAPASPDAPAGQQSPPHSHKTQNLNQKSREPAWSYGSGPEENQEPGRFLYLWNRKMLLLIIATLLVRRKVPFIWCDLI